MGQPAIAMAVDVPLQEDYRPAAGPTRNPAAENLAAAVRLQERGFYNPPQHMRRRAQAEGALEWLVNFVALTQPDLLPSLGLPEQWVSFMLDQNDEQKLEAQRMVYLAQLATPERLAMLARGRAAAMLYDAVTPQDWYYASRALGWLPQWVIGDATPLELMEEEGERRAKGQGPGAKAGSRGGGEEVRVNRAARRRLERMAGKG